MPALSVIVPVYNVESYLDRCLQSLEDQTFSDFEIVCVNDGSTDGSFAKLQEWAVRDSRIVVVSQENKGLSAARNTGMRKATGIYVCFLDSDDRFYPTACQSIVELLTSSGADVLTFGATCVPEKASDAWHYWALSPRNKTYEGFSMDLIMKEASRPFVWRMALRMDFVRQNSLYFDETVRFGEDQIYCFAAYARARKVRLSSKKLYEYQMARSGSLMEQAGTDMHDKMLKHVTIIDRIFEDWTKLGILHDTCDQMLPFALDFILPELIKVPQEQFGDVCDHLGQVLRKYFTFEDMLAAPNKADRTLLEDLYKRSSQNLARRKLNARDFYLQRYRKKHVYRWVLTGWYLHA